jgi:dihydrofolate reductase
MISLIAAVGRNLEIGWQGRLPWHLPNDLRHFKEVNKNKTIIMGSATYASMLDVTFSDRVVYVVSREERRYHKANAALSVSDAITRAQNNCSGYLTREIIVIGGVGVFREALPMIDKAYITLVEGDFSADRFFPVGFEYFFEWHCDRVDTFFATVRDPHQHTIYEFTRPKKSYI